MLLDLLIKIRDWWQNKPQGVLRGLRASGWRTVRTQHLEKEPFCQYCGGKNKLEVHHIIPFYIDPSKELTESNLITLCEGLGKNCHFVHGHLKNWKKYNPNIRELCNKNKIKKQH